MPIDAQDINPVYIDDSIKLLHQYITDVDIAPMTSALEALKQDTQNDTLMVELKNVFEGLGPYQGAVLTYAPYISILLADDPFL